MIMQFNNSENVPLHKGKRKILKMWQLCIVVISSPFLENNLGFIIQGHVWKKRLNIEAPLKSTITALFYLYLKAPWLTHILLASSLPVASSQQIGN